MKVRTSDAVEGTGPAPERGDAATARDCELLRREVRADLVLDAVQGHVYGLEVATGQVWRGPGLAELLGYSPQQVPESLDWWRAQIPPEDLDRVDAEGRLAVASRLPTLLNEHRVRCRDGRLIWVEDRCRLEYDAEGSLVRLLGCTFSIDARKRAELALQCQTVRQALLLQTSSALIQAGSDEAELAETLFQRLAGPLELDACLNYRPIPGTSDLELIAAPGVAVERRRGVARIARGDTFCGTVAATCKPLVADGRRIASDPAGHVAHQLGMSAYACHPLLARDGRLLGTLSFASARRTAFEPEDLEFFQTLSQFVSLGWERFEFERALQDSEQRYRLAMRAVEGYVYEWDVLRDTVECSEGFQRLLGGPAGPQEGARSNWSQRIHPDDLPRVSERWQQTLDGDTLRHEGEFRVRAADGQYLWLSDRAMLVRDQAGRVVRVIGSVQDITHRKQSEIALRESEQRFRTMADGLPLIVWVHDAEGHQEFVNRAYLDYFGLRSQEPDDDGWRLLLHPADAAAYAEALRASVAGRTPFHAETRVRVADGSWRRIESWGRPHFRASGEFQDFVGTSADITERHAAAEQLRLADRQKDEFLAMLAHELRNPLAPIRNATHMLEERLGTDPQLRAPIGVLGRQIRQLTRLVDDLLDVSRISQGRIELRLQPLDAKEVVEQAIETVQPLALAKNQQLSANLAAASIHVRGDFARLVQSVGNLLHNAVKYTGHGGRIGIEIEASEKDVVISVHDDGAGIGPDLLPRVFDLFVQSDRTLDRSNGGLGIGLSVVKRLIDMHGGSVDASSEGTGCGATFNIRLPRVAAPDVLQAVPDRASLIPRRVLVVDDNVDSADSLALLLRMDGHEVETAYDPESGLAAAARLQPDVVLLDIGLPRMDGYEVARRLRARSDCGNPYLVALTGYGQAADRERAKAAGFDEHLVKPADLDALARALAAAGRGPR